MIFSDPSIHFAEYDKDEADKVIFIVKLTFNYVTALSNTVFSNFPRN